MIVIVVLANLGLFTTFRAIAAEATWLTAVIIWIIAGMLTIDTIMPASIRIWKSKANNDAQNARFNPAIGICTTLTALAQLALGWSRLPIQFRAVFYLSSGVTLLIALIWWVVLIKHSKDAKQVGPRAHHT